MNYIKKMGIWYKKSVHQDFALSIKAGLRSRQKLNKFESFIVTNTQNYLCMNDRMFNEHYEVWKWLLRQGTYSFRTKVFWVYN